MASWRTGLHETGVDAIIVTAPAMLGWALLKHFFRKTDVHSWLLRCGQQLAGPAAPIQSTAVEVEKDACRKRLLLENKSPKRIKSAPCLLDTSSFTIDEDDEEDVDKDDEEDDDEDDEEVTNLTPPRVGERVTLKPTVFPHYGRSGQVVRVEAELFVVQFGGNKRHCLRYRIWDFES